MLMPADRQGNPKFMLYLTFLWSVQVIRLITRLRVMLASSYHISYTLSQNRM